MDVDGDIHAPTRLLNPSKHTYGNLLCLWVKNYHITSWCTKKQTESASEWHVHLLCHFFAFHITGEAIERVCQRQCACINECHVRLQVCSARATPSATRRTGSSARRHCARTASTSSTWTSFCRTNGVKSAPCWTRARARVSSTRRRFAGRPLTSSGAFCSIADYRTAMQVECDYRFITDFEL